jgi:serine-type D-Ala-D-Ala carboxypeptidase (penicillin-binding protein 5/6)
VKAPRSIVALAVALVAATAPATADAVARPEGNLGAARGYTVIDPLDGAKLDYRNPDQRLPIASATKLMTAYVVLKELPLDKIVRAAPYSPTAGESLLGLRAGERISVRDLLYGLILRSGNDAAYDLARAAAGSEAAFVRQMNRYAAALGLSDSHFANPIGLDQPGNYSSANDLAALTRRLLDIPAFAEIANSRHAVLRSLSPPRRISSINELLFLEPWATGVKTGHTLGAKYVLVASGHRRGADLIVVVIGANSDEERYGDALELFDYVFGFFRKRKAIYAGEALAEPSIRYSGGELPLDAAHAVKVTHRVGQGVSVSVRAPDEVEGPIADGETLGRAIVRVGGIAAASVPLKAAEAVPEASAWDRGRDFVEGSLGWIGLGLLGILVLIVVFLRRRSR